MLKVGTDPIISLFLFFNQMEEAIEKAESLVDSLLTLSADSLQDLLKYLVSDVSRAKLPAGSRFEAQVAQQTIVELKVEMFPFVVSFQPLNFSFFFSFL